MANIFTETGESELELATKIIESLVDVDSLSAVLSEQLLVTPERAKELCIAGLSYSMFPNKGLIDRTDSVKVEVWRGITDSDGVRMNSGTGVTVRAT